MDISLWTSLSLPFIVGLSTAYSIKDSVNSEWFKKLNSPTKHPFNFVFILVSVISYFSMGYSYYLFKNDFDSSGDYQIFYDFGVQLFWAQLLLDFVWARLLFIYRDSMLTLLVVGVNWVASLITLFNFSLISIYSGIYFLPYLIWVSYSSISTLALVQAKDQVLEEQKANLREKSKPFEEQRIDPEFAAKLKDMYTIDPKPESQTSVGHSSHSTYDSHSQGGQDRPTSMKRVHENPNTSLDLKDQFISQNNPDRKSTKVQDMYDTPNFENQVHEDREFSIKPDQARKENSFSSFAPLVQGDHDPTNLTSQALENPTFNIGSKNQSLDNQNTSINTQAYGAQDTPNFMGQIHEDPKSSLDLKNQVFEEHKVSSV